MPKSKNRKQHSQKLNNFKQKTKQQMNEQQNQMANGMPPVRNVPVWDKNAVIAMSGIEFEAMYNGLMGIQLAQQAINAVMSRNIVSGVIKMDFEKLTDPATGVYSEMSEEEKAPYVENFNKVLEQARNPQPPSQNATSDAGRPIAEPEVAAKPKVKKTKASPTAKVITMDAKAAVNKSTGTAGE